MTTSAEPQSSGPGRLARAGLIAIVALPIVAAAVRSVRRSWFPIGDSALLYIRAGDVFTRHHPLLGSWTSASQSLGENINNPAPTYDFLIAPFAHLLPPGPGAAIGVAVVNIGAVIAISAASRYIGGWAMQRWMLVAAAALAWLMGSELLIDMWQPHALLLPFLLFLVLLVGCAAGISRVLPFAAGVGSLLVQTHLGYVFITGLLILIVIGIIWWQHHPIDWRSIPDLARSRITVVTLLVLLVLWAHPLYEEFFGEGRGNLTRLVSNTSGGSLTLGWAYATEVTGSIMALPWWWARGGFAGPITNNQTLSPDGSSLVLVGLPSLAVALLSLLALTVGLGLLTRLAHRRGRSMHAAAGALVTASIPAVVISLSKLTIGPVGFATHHVRWLWSLAIFVTFAAAWIAVDIWSESQSESRTKWVTPTAIGLMVLFSVLNLGYKAQPEGPAVDYAAMPAMRRAFPEIAALAGHDPVLYDISNLRAFEPYSSAMMMRMQELGIEFRVTDEGFVRQLGNNRRADGTEATVVFQLERVQALDYAGPACTIALTSALSVSDEATARANAELFAQQLIDGSIKVDEALLLEDDRLDQFGAAREGNFDAAWILVIEGTLSRWTNDGLVTPQNPNMSTELDQINNWVTTSFGLFAEGPSPCPT